MVCNKKARKICCPNTESSIISKDEDTSFAYDYNSEQNNDENIDKSTPVEAKEESRNNSEIKCGVLLGSAQHALSGSGISFFAPWAVSIGKVYVYF